MKTRSINLFIVISILLLTACPQEVDFVTGCMDSEACNYNSDATDDDGSCNLPDGCTDVLACNYNTNALCDNGYCFYESDALDNPIEVVFQDDVVTGLVGEELAAHVHLRNASCQSLTLDATQSAVHPSKPFQAKFCLGDICYDWGTNDAAIELTLEPFEEGDYFQGYIQADEPGTYDMTYTIFTDSDTTIVTVSFEVN